MKRILLPLLALLTALTLTAPVLADSAPDDAFYLAHREECVESDEGFLAAEDTAVYSSPENGTLAGWLPAGSTAATPYLWTDPRGDEWGWVDYRGGDTAVRGWLNITAPTYRPAPAMLSPGVQALCVLLAVAAAGIAVFGRRKDERKPRKPR